MTLINGMRDFFLQTGVKKKYWVAFSGGLDSLVLLSLCHSLRESMPISLGAIHVNHGLSVNAKSWQAHCAQICRQYGIELVAKELQIELINGDSLEKVAREKRYQLFTECIKPDEVLLTAHHQDDQAETLLLQLCRGAGPKGLSAMPVLKPFGAGWHGRPLLEFTRDELHRYAMELSFQWIEDESNFNRKLTRNYIRHDIMPLLKNRWPTVTKALARSAAYCAEAQQLLEEFAQDTFGNLQGTRPNTLSVSKVMALNFARQKLILRLWIQSQSHPLPDSKKLHTLQTDVMNAAWDALPCVQWQDTELRRYRDDLYLLKKLPIHDSSLSYEWDFNQPLQLPNIGELSATKVRGKGFRADVTALSVSFRKGGEVANLPTRGHHTLKNLFQEWNVLPWERDRVPLIFVNKMLVSAVGYFIDDSVAAKNDEWGYELNFNPSY